MFQELSDKGLLSITCFSPALTQIRHENEIPILFTATIQSFQSQLCRFTHHGLSTIIIPFGNRREPTYMTQEDNNENRKEFSYYIYSYLYL